MTPAKPPTSKSKEVDGSGMARTLAAKLLSGAPISPKNISQAARSSALPLLGDSPRCHARKSNPSMPASASKSPATPRAPMKLPSDAPRVMSVEVFGSRRKYSDDGKPTKIIIDPRFGSTKQSGLTAIVEGDTEVVLEVERAG